MTGGPFPVQGLPYGVFSTAADDRPRVGVAIGDAVLDLAALADAGLLDVPVEVARAPVLNPLMALGPGVWRAVRDRLAALLSTPADRDRVAPALVPRDAARLRLPFAVADYVDFYASLDHATNLGRILRPGEEPLLPNWRHLPVAYHGRAGTVVVSGTDVRRPWGQVRAGDGAVRYAPTARLDFELEVGFVVGVPSEPGRPVAADAVADHVFGVVLVNDWSARDVQAWEYRPLGPFLGKSFATSVSAWVLPLDALGPVRVPGPAQDPPPLPYLTAAEPWGLDVELEAAVAPAGAVEPAVVTRTNARHLYWTVAQQLAHLTANGAPLRTGDLFASGTVSGPEPGSEGSLVELTDDGRRPLVLPDGATRGFLEDGDTVVLRGRARYDGVTVALGDVAGRVVP